MNKRIREAAVELRRYVGIEWAGDPIALPFVEYLNAVIGDVPSLAADAEDEGKVEAGTWKAHDLAWIEVVVDRVEAPAAAFVEKYIGAGMMRVSVVDLHRAPVPAASEAADLRAKLDAVTRERDEALASLAAEKAAHAETRGKVEAADRWAWNRCRTAVRAAIQARVDAHQSAVVDNGRIIIDRADSAHALTEAIQCRIVADLDYPGPVGQVQP